MNLLIIRLIIFAVLFLVGLKLYRMYREWKLDREELLSHDEREDAANPIVRCSYCKVHLPEADALREHGEWFCSSAHLNKYLEEQKDQQ